MAGNPAEPGYGLYKILQELADVQAAVKRLEQAPSPVYLEEATVTAFSGGSPYVTVQYDSGTSRTIGYLTTYTPTVGHRVLIASYPWGAVRSFVLSQLSA